jgi:hypothetical protein
LFCEDLCLEDDLQQQVAELIRDGVRVAAFDRFDRFAGFLEDVGGQTLRGLPGIPWTAARSTQRAHCGKQLQKRLARVVTGHEQVTPRVR